MGLRSLRSKMSIISQDPILLSGTVRSTLDPFSIYNDSKLWDALKRSFLVDEYPSAVNNSTTEVKSHQSCITLDTVVEPEGLNFSVGQRSLLSLARALDSADYPASFLRSYSPVYRTSPTNDHFV